MKIVIAAVGKWNNGPEKALFEAYRKRLPWELTLKETPEFGDLPLARRKAAQGEAQLEAAAGAEIRIALDERGAILDSREFAAQLGSVRDAGVRHIAFFIGGADGLDEGVRAQCAKTLALGKLTWPHMLVRPMLAEQIYRASAILAGHPYHRG